MKIDLKLDYEKIMENTEQLVHLAVVFTAQKQVASRKQPFALCPVIDCSGSMEGKPLEMAKKAASLIVRNLNPDDLFGLVVFSGSARAVVPLQAVRDRHNIVSSIDSIQSEGNTNLAAGWMLGRDELDKAPKDMPRRLLLLSDGHLNAGLTDPARVGQLAADGQEKHRIRTSCLGFGDAYNEDLMTNLASVSGGTMHDATSPEHFNPIFKFELEALQQISAQNVRVRIRKLHYCTGISFLSNYPVVPLPDGGVEVSIGDFASEEQRMLILALEVLPLPLLSVNQPVASLQGEKLLEIEILYDEFGENEVRSCRQENLLRILATQDPKDVRVDEEVLSWVATHQAGATLREAIHDMDNEDPKAALARIKEAIDRLQKHGKPDHVAEAITLLKNFELQANEWSPRMRKTTASASYCAERSTTMKVHLPSRPKKPKLPKI